MKQKPLLRESFLSGRGDRVFVITRYTEHADGTIVATTKHDVTDDFRAIYERWRQEDDDFAEMDAEAAELAAEGEYLDENSEFFIGPAAMRD